MAPFVFKSNQVAVANITESLKLFDQPIEEGGRTADVFFNLTLPIDSVRSAFRLEFNSSELNGVDVDDIQFHEDRSLLYKCNKQDPSGNAKAYDGVIWSDALADADQNKINKSWVTYAESGNNPVNKKITSNTHGMLLRAGDGNNPNNSLLYEMAEMAVKAHFDAPLDLLDNVAEQDLLKDISGQNVIINTALRNQLQSNVYTIDGSTGSNGQPQLKSLVTSRPVRRGICESLFASGMSQDADGNQTTDDFLHRIDNLVHRYKDISGGGVQYVTDPSNSLLNNVKMESLDISSNHILMDFPMAVNDKIQLTLIYVVQSKLETADNILAVGPRSNRKNQTNSLREFYGSRVDGYQHSGQVSLTTDLSGESLAFVGGAEPWPSDPSANRYGPLFMNATGGTDTSGNPIPAPLSFAESQNSLTQYSFMNRVAQIEITLTKSGTAGYPLDNYNADTTFLKPATVNS
jgi:hypothetical protein